MSQRDPLLTATVITFLVVLVAWLIVWLLVFGVNPDDYRIRYYTPFGDELPDQWAWAKLLEHTDKRVAVTTFADGVWVSTVWLGLDHQFWPGRPPLIYETMVFAAEGTAEDQDCQRYSTLAQAWPGHWQMVALVTVAHGEPVTTELGVLGQMAKQDAATT